MYGLTGDYPLQRDPFVDQWHAWYDIAHNTPALSLYAPYPRQIFYSGNSFTTNPSALTYMRIYSASTGAQLATIFYSSERDGTQFGYRNGPGEQLYTLIFESLKFYYI